jgi:hypothetical protein
MKRRMKNEIADICAILVIIIMGVSYGLYQKSILDTMLTIIVGFAIMLVIRVFLN